jgi:hypothetical protein
MSGSTSASTSSMSPGSGKCERHLDVAGNHETLVKDAAEQVHRSTDLALHWLRICPHAHWV